MSIDPGAAAVTGMEDVLAAHWSVSTHTDQKPFVDKCDGCGEVILTWGGTGDSFSVGAADLLAKHQAAELEAAGFGNLHDAWAEGWGHYRQHFGILDPEFANNPYPKVSET